MKQESNEEAVDGSPHPRSSESDDRQPQHAYPQEHSHSRQKQLAMPRMLNKALTRRDVNAHEASQPHHQTEEVFKIDPTVNDPKPQHLDAPHETVEASVIAGSKVVHLG